MPVAVTDTGPFNYLVLIGEIELLPALFDSVFVPEAARVAAVALALVGLPTELW